MFHLHGRSYGLWAGFCALCLLVSWSAAAQNFEPDACQTEIWDTMKERSWLEAQREISQNQNHMFKPDSVLEYTCFDQYYTIMPDDVAQIMSETQVWGSMRSAVADIPLSSAQFACANSHIPSPYLVLCPHLGTMPVWQGLLLGSGALMGVGLEWDEITDIAIDPVIRNATWGYLGGNFGHTYLGGRSPLFDEPADVDYGLYLCDAMAYAWGQAKCWNFMTDEYDGFFSFQQYRDFARNDIDVRQFPPPDPCLGNLRWELSFDTAIEDPLWLQVFNDPANAPRHPRTILTLIRERLTPGICSTPPIPTGIRNVHYNVPDPTAPGGATYDDHFCTNPGCEFLNNGECE